MKYLLAGLVLVTAGCANRSITEVLSGERVKGDLESVTVSGFDSVASALPFAVAHCTHYRRSARYERRVGDGIRFRCAP